MLIIFGWEKDIVDIPNFTQCYCYNCDDAKRWVLNIEREWVSFFAIKTIPFLTKRKIYCERCGDTIRINHHQYLTFKKGPIELTHFIEHAQLAKKTAIQRTYLLERRAKIDHE